MSDKDRRLSDLWDSTRSGAWAGRGFHYQYLFSAHILIRQMMGLLPIGSLVPEGTEDCVVEMSDKNVIIQVKSRKEGKFRRSEVMSILDRMSKNNGIQNPDLPISMIVGLEQSCSDYPISKFDDLLDGKSRKVVVCTTPDEQNISLLSKRFKVPVEIAKSLTSELYNHIAVSASQNASRPFKERRRISITEVERLFYQRLKAIDPSAVDQAILSGILKQIDFVTPVSEPSFYLGVKVSPGHLAARLVIERPKETQSIVDMLFKHRHLIVTGPSGAGKSALVWLVSNSLSNRVLWYRVSSHSRPQDVEAIVRFLNARHPKASSPIGLVFDDLGEVNCNTWNILTSELRGLPHVYLLGSIRKEDEILISNRSDTAFYEVKLHEDIAERIWSSLTLQRKTKWQHWREPYEQSDGLMLEFVHLLTQGQRFVSVIKEQILQRESENRTDELAILRYTSAICARDGEVESRRLFELLDLTPQRAKRAINRLKDEHLICETRPGVLGGLHRLRSKALCTTSHDDVVYHQIDSVTRSIVAVTNDTLPGVIQTVLGEISDHDVAETIQFLACSLSVSDDLDYWSAVFTGLGLGTLDRAVDSFTAILKSKGVKQSHWRFASFFVDSSIELNPSTFAEFDQGEILRDALLKFRRLPKDDLRLRCMRMLPEGFGVPKCSDLLKINRFLSCLIPIAGGTPIELPLFDIWERQEEDNLEIRDVAALLSTAYLINQDLANSFARVFGGEGSLIKRFSERYPWTTKPSITINAKERQVIHSNHYYISNLYQPDPHETVMDICEMLLAISPTSDEVHSEAVNAFDGTLEVGDMKLVSKTIQRTRLPAKARVAWNVAFCHILLSRVTSDSLTYYTAKMSEWVNVTETFFKRYSEKWIKGRRLTEKDRQIANKILDEVNEHVYAKNDTLSFTMTSPANNSNITDELGDLLGSVLGNLIPRMDNIPSAPGARGAAAFAASLSSKVFKYKDSAIWRTTSSPPRNKLSLLAKRLYDVSCILNEIAAYKESNKVITWFKKVSKSTIPGKAVGLIAKRCISTAERRLRERLDQLNHKMMSQGWNVICFTRSIEKIDSPYWPPLEVSILVEIEDFESNSGFPQECISIGTEVLKGDWQFSVVPMINNKVLPTLAFCPSRYGPLPYEQFLSHWDDCIDLPFLESEISDSFVATVKAIDLISSILKCCDPNEFHPVEEDVLTKAVNDLNRNLTAVASFSGLTNQDLFDGILFFIGKLHKRIESEIETVNNGAVVISPICEDFANPNSDMSIECVGANALLLQSVCQ